MRQTAKGASSTIDRLSRIWQWIASIALGVMLIFVEYNVIARYLGKNPLGFAEEYASYLLAAVSFFALAFTFLDRRHPRVELVSVANQGLLRGVILSVTLLFVVVIFWTTLQLVIRSYVLDVRAAGYLRTPLYIPQIVMPLGLALFIVALVVQIIRTFREV